MSTEQGWRFKNLLTQLAFKPVIRDSAIIIFYMHFFCMFVKYSPIFEDTLAKFAHVS